MTTHADVLDFFTKRFTACGLPRKKALLLLRWTLFASLLGLGITSSQEILSIILIDLILVIFLIVNLVLSFSTDLDVHTVIACLDEAEVRAGRARSAESFVPRTLDLDLLLYGQQVLDESAVRVPRADILQYAFVLAPIAELAPDLRHPVDGRTMCELWSAFEGGDQGIRRLAEPLL